MNCVLFVIIFVGSAKFSKCIYSSNFENSITPSRVKTSWSGQNKNLQLHHNYSKVALQNSENFDPNYGHSYSQQESRESERLYPIYNGHTYGQRPETHQEIVTHNVIRNNRQFENDPSGGRVVIIKRKKEISKPIEVYSKCPEDATGQFVYDLACNQFLNCWKGRGFVQSCAPGTMFNPKTLECDFPQKVECITGPRQNILRREITPKSIEQINCPVGFTGLIPNYTDCSKFINCNNGVPQDMTCPPGTLFDVNKNVCDHADSCTCFKGLDKKHYVNINEEKYDFHGYGSTPTYHTHESYNQNPYGNHNFYVTQKTPYQSSYESSRGFRGSTSYNQGQTQQNIDSKLDFSTTNCGRPNCQRNENSNGYQTTYSQNTQYTDDTRSNCGTSNCENPHSSANTYTSQTTYDRRIDNTPPYSDQNAQYTGASLTNCRTPNCQSQGNSQNYGSYSQNPQTTGTVCNLRIQNCPNSQNYQQSFPQTSQQQNFRTNYHTVCNIHDRNCRQQNTGIYRSQDPENDIICPNDVAGLHPHPTDCSKFLNCANGQTFVQNCGPGTHFNPVTKACDWPHNVQCSRGQTNSAPTQISAWSAPTPTRSGKYAFNSNDKAFPIEDLVGRVEQNCGSSQGCRQTGSSSQGYSQQTGQSYGNSKNSQVYGKNSPGFEQNSQSLSENSQSYGQSLGNSQGYGQNFPCKRGEDCYQPTWNNQLKNVEQSRTPSHSGVIINSQFGRTTLRPWNGFDTSPPTGSTFGKPLAKPITTWSGYSEQNVQHFPKNQLEDFEQTSSGFPSLIHVKPTVVYNGNIEQNVQHSTKNHLEEFEQSSNSFPSQNEVDYEDTYNPSSTHKHLTVRSTTPSIIERVWPPQFPTNIPSTDVNADYVYEYDEIEAVTLEPENQNNAKRKAKFDCFKGDFHCSSRKCVPKNLACNKVKDCPDGEDEYFCSTYLAKFTKRNDSRLAVIEKQRWDNVTTETCALLCLDCETFECKSFNYRKIDKTCFLTDTNIGISGALISYYPCDYYERKADQVDCRNLYKCPNHKCIKKSKLCDGHNDCGDRDDEKNCPASTLGYELRLAGSYNKNEGRVVVTAFGKTGYICDDQFSMVDADVICRELGYSLGALEVKTNSFFSKQLEEAPQYMMDELSCSGNETSLRDCDFNEWGVHDCGPQEVAGVICKTKKSKCSKDFWKCDTGNECIPLAFVCDGLYDCEDNSDEGSQHCEAATEIRIVNGTNSKEGRVEIKHHGIWGSVCDDDFNEDAAKVVCTYLGYHGSATVKKEGYFGAGEGPIWLDQVSCYGNESHLEDCTHWDWGEHNCDHTEDVGVICSNYVSVFTERHAPKAISSTAVFPETCGLRKDSQFMLDGGAHFRVVNGGIAKKGEYPWQASLKVKGKNLSAHWCGAVIVSQKFVISAAHCLIGYPKDAYIVSAGDYNTDDIEGTEQEVYIEDYYIHEDFRRGHKMNNDIALVKLKGTGFRLNQDVQPICLPQKDIDYESGDLNCTISGFGTEHSGKSIYSHNMRAGWLPILPSKICKMPHVYGTALTDGMFCAGYLDGGVDACDGDSGGPLACLKDGYFTLYGITSWGQHCGFANKPGVYVKIGHYRTWIEKILNKYS